MLRALYLMNAIILSASSVNASDVCTKLSQRLNKLNTEKATLILRKQELTQKFEKHIESDFKSQSEGILSEINQNKARKVHFARRKLKLAIRRKNRMITEKSVQFCKSCSPSSRTPASLQNFCFRCPSKPECGNAIP